MNIFENLLQSYQNLMNLSQFQCFWKNAKIKFKRMCGVHGDQLDSYLDEYMWRNRHPNRAEHLNRILEAISQMHPTP